MGFGLLTPAFLLGLVALSVPILVHLVHRQQREPVAFPSLMFLQRIPHTTLRRQRLRHRWLLVLRCLAIVLLCLAFARPVLESRSGLEAVLSGDRERVVLLDRSFSMGHGDLWERARDAARAAVTSLDPGDRASLVVFAGDAQAVGLPTDRASQLSQAVASISPGADVTRYAPALRLARERLLASARPRREVVLISDFQKSAWEPELEELQLPEGATLETVNLSAPSAANTAIIDVRLARPTGQRGAWTISARLVHWGPQPRKAVTVSLELDGQRLEERVVDLSPGATLDVSFAPVAPPTGTARGTARLAPDALPLDDVFQFALRAGRGLPVLIVEPAGSRPNASLYLERALGIGDDPRFEITVRSVTSFQSRDLEEPSVVVWNGAPLPSAELRDALAGFVEQGGGLLVALGEELAGTAGRDATAPFPARGGLVVDRDSDSGATLAHVDYDHPVFEPFKAPRGGDLSAPRFLRYRSLEEQPGDRVLARFDDGAVALAERRHGKGRVLLWTSSLDTFWNDLALSPLYLPLAHQLVRHAAAYTPEPPWQRVGDVVDLGPLVTEDRTLPDGALSVTSPSGQRVEIALDGDRPLIELTEAGFYEVRYGTGRESVPLAANPDPSESDLSALDPEELSAVLTTRGGGERSAEIDADPGEPRELSWLLLLAGLGLLLAEAALANHLSPRAPASLLRDSST